MAPSQLDIKTRALGRLIKEESLYHQELSEQERVVASMKQQQADPYELKKQVEVLEDTRKMIPELRKKVKESLGSLEHFLGEYSGDDDLTMANANIAAAKVIC